jgi:hypothetical protein
MPMMKVRSAPLPFQRQAWAQKRVVHEVLGRLLADQPPRQCPHRGVMRAAHLSERRQVPSRRRGSAGSASASGAGRSFGSAYPTRRSGAPTHGFVPVSAAAFTCAAIFVKVGARAFTTYSPTYTTPRSSAPTPHSALAAEALQSNPQRSLDVPAARVRASTRSRPGRAERPAARSGRQGMLARATARAGAQYPLLSRRRRQPDSPQLAEPRAASWSRRTCTCSSA